MNYVSSTLTTRQALFKTKYMERQITILPDEGLREGLSNADDQVIIETITEAFKTSACEIKSYKRTKALIIPRHLIHYFLSVKTNRSFSEIGLITMRDHSTVINSKQVIENWLQYDKRFRSELIMLACKITSNSQKQTIQIIGKITGDSYEQVKQRFAHSEYILKERGYNVINPCALVPELTPWNESMRICIQSLLNVDAIAIHPDWVNSEGARLEYLVAEALQLKQIRL